MQSLLISETDIMSYVDNSIIYRRGHLYYLEKKVQGIELHPEKLTVQAMVLGTSTYDVEVTFTKTGKIHSSCCTCPAYHTYDGPCKHIAAVLIAARRTLQTKNIPAPDNHFQVANEIINFFAGLSLETKKTEVQLELSLFLRNMSYGILASMELKIGLDRLYVLKNAKEFLVSLAENRETEFGKRFTFEPDKHTFSAPDQNVISLLQEILAHDSSSGPFYTLPGGSAFQGKTIHLNDPHLKKLLDIIEHRPFNLFFGANPSVVTTVRSTLPVLFSVESAGEDLALNFQNDVRPVALTRDGSYFYYQESVFKASADQQKYFFPLFKNHLQKKKNIIFPSACKDLFVTEVLPQIKKISRVDIAPSLEQSFCREDLTAKIFFDKTFAGEDDREEAGIGVRLEFHYGDKIIRPFSPAVSNADEKTPEKIVIRDMEKEHTIFDLLEAAEFTVKQGEIHLFGNEKIFNFAVNILPKLQEIAEIYYADTFKAFNIRSSASLSGRVRLNEDLDLLEFSFQVGELSPEELQEVFASLKLKRKYHRLKDGSFMDFGRSGLEKFATLLEHLDVSAAELQADTIQLPKFRAMYMDNFLRENDLSGIGRNRAFKQLVQSIQEPQDMEHQVPEDLQTVMRDYQKTGFKWLKTLAAYGLGGILADDMGLGKTLQVISFVLSEKVQNPKPSLVIAPTSLVYNWYEEVQKFVPAMNVEVITGTPEERQAKLADINNADMVITSYPLIRRDIDWYRGIAFNYCFLDEAQHIKNPNTLNAKSVQQIKAKNYFALTGTPIENSLTELWSIFNFILPGYLLAHSSFQKRFEQPIAKGDEPQAMMELSRHIRPFILRRLKKDVLTELPDKIETKLIAEMTDEQKKIYLSFLKKAQGEIASEISAAGFEKSRIKILALLTRLRQICCHPALFVENYDGESGKFMLLQEVLEDAISGGHRILLFSQFTSMLSLIKEHLQSQKIDYFYLDGQTKAEARLDMVRAFNGGESSVFLISLKAGGTGLNLTGADMVIHFDPWWNPAVEQQAADRAHRIGQSKVVQVLKLITKGTIEEKIFTLQQKKKELIDNVIKPGETFLAKMTESELKELFEI